MNIKLKPFTSELIERTAVLTGYPLKDVREVFHAWWLDVSICFSKGLGYSIELDNFGCFYLNFRHLSRLIDKKEQAFYKRSMRLKQYVNYSNLKEWDDLSLKDEKMRGRYLQCMHYLTDIILIVSTIQLYEKLVISQFPKKYRPNKESIEAVIGRLEKSLGVPFSTIPIAIRYPIQEIYVRKLYKFGVLPNPILSKDSKM